MSNYVLFMGFIITLPIQAMIVYSLKEDLKEYKEAEEKKQRSLNNLLGKDSITVELTDEDMFLIENLIRHEDCETIEQYIRKEIKKINGA